jgi:hypothetical protein
MTACPAHRDQITGLRRLRFYLAAQLLDMDIDGAGFKIEVPGKTPDLRQ